MSFDPLPVAAGQRSNTGIRLADQDAMRCPFTFQNGAAFLLGESTGMNDLDDHRRHLPVGETNHAPVFYRFHPVRQVMTPALAPPSGNAIETLPMNHSHGNPDDGSPRSGTPSGSPHKSSTRTLCPTASPP